MMAGSVGRDKYAFNCGGHHGLTQYVAVCNGMACDFCGTPIRTGELAKGCRHGPIPTVSNEFPMSGGFPP